MGSDAQAKSWDEKLVRKAGYSGLCCFTTIYLVAVVVVVVVLAIVVVVVLLLVGHLGAMASWLHSLIHCLLPAAPKDPPCPVLQGVLQSHACYKDDYLSNCLL